MKKLLLIYLVVGLFFWIFTSEVNAQVLINEFSSSDSSDWVELYAFEDTDISGWILRDTADSKMDTIPNGIIIGPTKSSSFYVAEVGNRLNIDGDIIKLLKPDDTTEINQVPYGDQGGVCAPGPSESAGRVDNGNTIERFTAPTKGQTNVGAQINPCPTPTPEPTSVPTSTPTPVPTPTKTPTPVPTKTPTPKPTSTTTPTPNNIADQDSTPTDVLGISDSPTPTSESKETQNATKSKVLAIVFIALGILSIGGASYSIWYKSKNPPPPNTL